MDSNYADNGGAGYLVLEKTRCYKKIGAIRRIPTYSDASLPLIQHRGIQFFASSILLLSLLCVLLTACSSPSTSSSANTGNHRSLASNNGTITYSASPQAVLIRTFYGGGNLGSFEISPDISIYGDGSYILGPGLQMRQGKLNTDSLQQLLHTLVDTDGLLQLNRQQFYDVPDQNATVLQLTLNGKFYEFLYGPFANLQESAQDIDEYHRLGNALTSITEAFTGPTSPYTSSSMALLVHQDFSPDLTQTIPTWSVKDFTLADVATYECGPTPQDINGPNASSGCLTLTVPRKALLLSQKQLQAIMPLLQNQQQGEFQEQGLYYRVTIRPLLPDELAEKMLAMFGSAELTYAGVPLMNGPVPEATTTP